MHGYLTALLVATLATAFLTFGMAPVEAPQLAAPISEPPNSVAAADPPAQFATVSKPFGASIRVAPSLEAPGLDNAPCGTSLPVVSAEQGWVQVRTEAGVGWIGSGRVATGGAPPAADCAGERFLYSTAEAFVFVPASCLEVRVRPSDDASALACVGNGHQFTVVDGPFEPGSGVDWFKVTSATTGTGWVPADVLFPTLA